MAKKQTKNKLRMKLEMLERLISYGFNTEEKIVNLMPKDVISFSDITFDDMNLIAQIQERIKSNSLFDFLAEDIYTENTIKQKKKDGCEVKANGK